MRTSRVYPVVAMIDGQSGGFPQKSKGGSKGKKRGKGKGLFGGGKAKARGFRVCGQGLQGSVRGLGGTDLFTSSPVSASP